MLYEHIWIMIEITFIVKSRIQHYNNNTNTKTLEYTNITFKIIIVKQFKQSDT